MKHRLIALVAILIASAIPVACATSDDSGTDAGTDSGGGMDSAKADTGAQDTGAQDSGADTTTSDTGTTDGGVDAGPGYDFMVVRVGGTFGDGGADAGALTNASTQVFLEERRTSDGMLLRTIPMPTAPSGNNQPLTVSGSSLTEGALTRSDDGKFVVMAGYASAPGTAAIAGTASMTTHRVVGFVDTMGTIDTSTRLNSAYNTANIRGAASKDGTAFWTSGAAGTQGSGGVWYATLGQLGGTQIFTGQTNMREVGVFSSQLYGSTQAGNVLRVFTIGTGLPTTANQASTELPGVTNANTMPNGFVLLDLNNMVSGVDTMYVADDQATNSGGGVQKWTFDGNTWTLKATFANGLTTGVNNVTADAVGMNVVVIAVTAESPTRLVRYIDDGNNLTPMATALATAQPNTQFRGIALSPK